MRNVWTKVWIICVVMLSLKWFAFLVESECKITRWWINSYSLLMISVRFWPMFVSIVHSITNMVSNVHWCGLMILVECYFGTRHSLCKNWVSFCETTLLKTSDLKISLFCLFSVVWMGWRKCDPDGQHGWCSTSKDPIKYVRIVWIFFT